jgi:thiamine kinase-like enzyme
MCEANTTVPAIDFDSDIDAGARDDVAATLLGWDRALFGGRISVSRLPGGANNRNYAVTSGTTRYALRIANQFNERMAVDRDSARCAQVDAAAIGVAPAVLAHRRPEGHLLCEFASGTALSVQSISQPRVLVAVAHLFQKLHAATSGCRDFDAFHDIGQWVDHARSHGEPVPPATDELLQRAERVRGAIATAHLPRVFCHNDTVPQNFLWDGGDVHLVDWDYAGKFYAAFELGSFICTADLDDPQRDTFLRAYADDLDEPAHARIRLMQFVAGLREIAWVLQAAPMLRGTTMVADTFYDEYLANNVRRACRFGLDPQFDALVETAAERGTSATV